MKRHRTSLSLLVLAWTFAFCEQVVATEDSPSQPAERFMQTVQPLLKAKCLSCHGPDKQEGGLRLESLQSAIKGGDSGPAIVPGDAAKSLLVKAVRFDDPDLQMPPKDQLAAKEIEALTQWVNDGAVWPRPVLVLFDDEEAFLSALTKGEAKSRFERRDTHRGSLALAVSPREKFAEQIADWKLPIREKPGPGEYRYFRYAWKKTGGGGAMLEVAREGKWPPAKATSAPGGRYVAGPNETGMDAIMVDDAAPTDWTVVTIDFWKRSPPQDGRVEIAYFTFPEHEGRGIATQMARQLIQLARAADRSVGIVAQTFPEENASTAILRKLGFSQTAMANDSEAGEVFEWSLNMNHPPTLRKPNEGRTVAVVGDVYRFLATGDDTDGKYAMWEAIMPPGGGPPPHIHSREEESFFILEGEITFQVGEEKIVATTGVFANMPVGNLHSFKNTSDKQRAG